MSGLAHRPRNGGQTHGRAPTGVLINGTATRGKRRRPKDPTEGERAESPEEDPLGDPWGTYVQEEPAVTSGEPAVKLGHSALAAPAKPD